MKTAHEILKDHPELQDHPAVQELVVLHEQTADALIDLQQAGAFSKEKELKVLVKELLESIARMKKHNDEADRFGYEDKLDYEEGVFNLQRYIQEYLRDYRIYL